ncbi:MAG: hypothetical protein KME22_11440 [Hassallia sp. WJT32-NPBG1]|nr:hypothetical protein [Hassallia sp. WJT32-NPBG1]
MDGRKRTAGKVGGVDPDRVQQARDAVLDNWKIAKRAESKERIALALDKFAQELTKRQ